MKAIQLGLGVLLLCGPVMAQVTTTQPQPVPPLRGSAGTEAPAGMPQSNPPGTTANAPAQLNPGNNASPTPPAVTTSNANQRTAAAPVKGRSSFTAAQARRRIEAGGFTQVADLHKDRDGIWRGKAMHNGARVNVYCDYQGNVGAS